jgi:hypothetical protein
MVIGLPRSLTSRSYHWLARALGLRRPSWTTDGEVLNPDRFTFAQASRSARHFLDETDGRVYHACLEFARAVLAPRGHAYKVVTQPAVAHALWHTPDEAARFRILRISRRLADVAFALLRRDWMYPSRYGGDTPTPETLVRGLVLAECLLREIPALDVHFDDLVHNPTTLATALSGLYPELAPSIHLPRFHDETFEREREAVLARRKTPEYRHLEELLESVEHESPARPAGGVRSTGTQRE